MVSSIVTVLNVKPYFCIFCNFFFFFNKCSFWNLLLQIKCGTLPTVGGNGDSGEGRRVALHGCIQTYLLRTIDKRSMEYVVQFAYCFS